MMTKKKKNRSRQKIWSRCELASCRRLDGTALALSNKFHQQLEERTSSGIASVKTLTEFASSATQRFHQMPMILARISVKTRRRATPRTAYTHWLDQTSSDFDHQLLFPAQCRDGSWNKKTARRCHEGDLRLYFRRVSLRCIFFMG